MDLQAALRSFVRPREAGETAFPSLGDIERACEVARGKRYQAEDAERLRRIELEEAEHRRLHPEEYMRAEDFWGSQEVKELLGKTRMM